MTGRDDGETLRIVTHTELIRSAITFALIGTVVTLRLRRMGKARKLVASAVGLLAANRLELFLRAQRMLVDARSASLPAVIEGR